MKKCTGCKQTLPLAQFSKKVQGKYYQSRCNPCKAEYARKWYEANKESKKQQSADYVRKYAEWGRSLKDGPCTDCGTKYPWYQMEWDHLPEYEKISNVSLLLTQKRSRQLILDEIAKCELVCVLCHTQRTFERREQAKSGGN